MRQGLRKTTGITLPESLWLLNLIDYMKFKGLIKAEGWRGLS